MGTEDFQPRSKALREALGRSGEDKANSQVMVNVPDACKRLQISKWTLYRLINAGKLGSVKIGSRRLIPVRAIEKYVDELEKEGGGATNG